MGGFISTISNLLKKIFGTSQSRAIAKYKIIVEQINAIEAEYRAIKLSKEAISNKHADLKKRYKTGATLDELLPEAYALVKYVCHTMCGSEIHISGYDQKWDMVPYDVQIIGAIAMHKNSVAEMQTGEGKTLTAVMPLYLHSLTEQAVHLVTVNDYLAKRDCAWVGSILRELGLTVAYLTNDVSQAERKEVYAADVVYGTASEFGFDYLRDNMASTTADTVQRGHFFAIIDEIDSILIDEAKTPLIISGTASNSLHMYGELKHGVAQIVAIQQGICNKIANSGYKELAQLGCFDGKVVAKQDRARFVDTMKSFWIVSKGMPRNRLLKKVQEVPLLRSEIDKWETYYHGDQNKEEREEVLLPLLITLEIRSNDYELTDKGIKAWASKYGSSDDFTMLDLGYEYAKIESAKLSQDAQRKAFDKLKRDDQIRKERSHNIRQLLRAHLLMEKDVEYIVQDGKVIVVDENTGRPQPGRRFSNGLHQALEAKESLVIQQNTQTCATITLQNYFRLYKGLAGMTGTAITDAAEFHDLYKLNVLQVPTYRPSIRKDLDDKIFMTEREKYNAILDKIATINSQGRPILIGTESVDISEKLSHILNKKRFRHSVLNAKNHEKEAEIIANAGQLGAITLATNMAGRGTDIKISPEVKELGGLYVLGTSRHSSRRIDRQLRGRAGRLGDPGSSEFFISFEDSLFRYSISPRMLSLLKRCKPEYGESFHDPMLTKAIARAQKTIEQRNYTRRHYTLKYDSVLNQQRQEVFRFRNSILKCKDASVVAKDILTQAVAVVLQGVEDGFCKKAIRATLQEHFLWSPIIESSNAEALKSEVCTQLITLFEEKIVSYKQLMEQAGIDIVRKIMLGKFDELWQSYLMSIDNLKEDVNLRTVAQKDPLDEFSREAFYLFSHFFDRLKLEISQNLLRFELIPSALALRSNNKSDHVEPFETD